MSRRRRLRRLRRLAAYGLAVLALWLGFEWLRWPDVAVLAERDPQSTAFVDRYREERRRAGEVDTVAWIPVPYARISPHLKRAVLVGEDIDFFSHQGFAVEEIRAAVRDAVENLEVPRGASTITQQLAKNLWLSPSRNPLRKLREILLTRQLEQHLDKRRILELYLNVVELGPGVYGAEAAARRYFRISAANLDEHQAAQLAAGLPRPASWHPGADGPGYRARVALLESRMRKAQWLWKVI